MWVICARPMKADLLKLLGRKDMAIQTYFPKKEACTDFFICHCNEASLGICKNTKLEMEHSGKIDDQTAFNIALKKYSNLRLEYLPERYAHGSMLVGRYYRRNDKLYIPKDVVLYHVNYTKGVALKVHQVQRVKKIKEHVKLFGKKIRQIIEIC
jgi:Nucleotide-diphospho-sugar transferase